MSLIIEDGSEVTNANSFVTVLEVQEYASSRGLDLLVDGIAATEAQIEIMVVKAMDYIQYLEPRFQGKRYSPETQALPFPRYDISIWGADISGLIPKILKDAVCRLVFDASEGDLLGNTAANASGTVLKEKVGALETQYAGNADSSEQTTFTTAMALLEPLFSAGSGTSGHGLNICCSR